MKNSQHINQLILHGIVAKEPDIIKGFYGTDYVRLMLDNSVCYQNNQTFERRHITYRHKVLFIGNEELISKAHTIKPSSQIKIKAQLIGSRIDNPYFESVSTEIIAYNFEVASDFDAFNHVNQLDLQGLVGNKPEIIKGANNLDYVKLVLSNDVYYQNTRTLEQRCTPHWYEILFIDSKDNKNLISEACNIKSGSEIKIKAQLVNSVVNNSYFESISTQVMAYDFEVTKRSNYL